MSVPDPIQELIDRRSAALARFLADNAELFSAKPEDCVGAIDGTAPAGFVLTAWWDDPLENCVVVGAWCLPPGMGEETADIASQVLGYVSASFARVER